MNQHKTKKHFSRSQKKQYRNPLCIRLHSSDGNFTRVHPRRLCWWYIHRQPDSCCLPGVINKTNSRSQNVMQNKQSILFEHTFSWNEKCSFSSVPYPGSKPICDIGTSRGTRASGTPSIGTTLLNVTSFPTCSLKYHTNKQLQYLCFLIGVDSTLWSTPSKAYVDHIQVKVDITAPQSRTGIVELPYL